MCGIAGWFDTKGERSVDPALVKAMSTAIAHRGPDGEGFFFGPGVAFGHRRLAVIDLVTGDQPMFSADRKVCITFNGEIYNYREVRNELKQKGHHFLTESDTEVIIQAWREWGSRCVNYLTGMFAFALWDEAQSTLFLARDRLGEKPLFYSVLPDGTFTFASEIKALLVHPGIARDIDPLAVEEYFALGYVAEPRSIFANISKLPAGFVLTARRGRKVELYNYWNPSPAQIPATELSNLDEVLLERLGKIVKSQLVADVPVGAFLSGGVDSSGTTALMARASSTPVTAFTIGFNNASFDETEYAGLVASRYAGKHIVEQLKEDVASEVDLLPSIFDEPFGDSSALPAHVLTKLARKHVTVAISGDGGDELFAGYRRYAFHAREEALRKFVPAPLRKSVFGTMADLYPQMDWAPRFLRARHTLRELSLDSAMGYFWNVSVMDDAERSSIYSSQMRRALGGYHAVEVLNRYAIQAPTDETTTIAQFIDLKTWMPGDILTKVDRTAMACGLEVRVPMLDHSFVDWALGLPISAKLQGKNGKVALKRAFSRLLPKELMNRPKQGFSVPLATWFRGELGMHFQRVMNRDGRDFASAEWIDPKKVNGLLSEHLSGAFDHSRSLWLIWMFELFMRGLSKASSGGLAKVEFST